MTRDERVRRAIDGELTREEERALELDAARDPELSTLLRDERARAHSIAALPEQMPAGLVDRVFRAALEAPPRPLWERAFSWLWEPRTHHLRTRPGVLMSAVLVVGLAGLLGSSSPAPRDGRDDSRIPVRLSLDLAGASRVDVIGDFNGWSPQPLDDGNGDGVFATTMHLARGSYDYLFLIDGERLMLDPHAAAVLDDGFGRRNGVLRVD